MNDFIELHCKIDNSRFLIRVNDITRVVECFNSSVVVYGEGRFTIECKETYDTIIRRIKNITEKKGN